MDADSYRELAIAAFELGLPIVAAFCLVYAPRLRNIAATILGAITPLVLVYLSELLWHFFRISLYSTGMSFYVLWSMSFITYLALAGVGLLLGLIPKPANLYLRFLIGLASAPLTYHAFYLF